MKHPAVGQLRRRAQPDETRGAVVKAFVLLAPGHAASDALKDSIREHVKSHLAPYQQPREIEFVARAADDHDREGAAQGAARAEAKRKEISRGLTSSDPPTA